jgi:hypothetical protein
MKQRVSGVIFASVLILTPVFLVIGLGRGFLAPIGSANAQSTSTPLNPEAERKLLQLHSHPIVLSVAGVPLVMPSVECTQLVERALLKNQEVPVGDDTCHKLMLQALELERNAPPDDKAVMARPLPERPNPNGPPPWPSPSGSSSP